MKRRLIREVRIEGPDFFGRKSCIIFRPNDCAGWKWQCPDGTLVDIGPEIVRSGKRRLILERGKMRLNTFEHIGPAKWLGFNDVSISSGEWPPYFGRAWEYCDALLRNSEEVDEHPKWFTVEKDIKFEYPSNGQRYRYTEIIPSENRQLELEIICDYEGVGSGSRTFIFPAADGTLEKILKTHTQGWPRSSLLIYRFATRFLRWPHHERIVWPHQYQKKEVLELFIQHRALDILGAVSAAHPKRRLSAKIVSFCSGHLGDVEAIRMINGVIIDL